MASVTCGLTAEDRDQLRNLTLVSSIGLIYLTYEKIQFRQNVISKMTKTKWLENRRPPPKTEVVTEVHELESWMTKRWRADEYASPEFFRSSRAIWVAGGFSWVIYQRAFGTCNLTHIDYITDGAITYMYSLSRKIKRSIPFNLEQKITMKISRCLIIVGVQHSEETWYRKMITVHVILTCKTVAELPWAVQKVIFHQYSTAISVE